MKPDKALELVMRFSALTQALKACRIRIGEHLNLCNGLKGFRNETEWHEHFDGTPYQSPTDRAVADEETHLKAWYTPDFEYGDGYSKGYVDVDMVSDECPHCYAAHLVIQERKLLRRQLGAVKAAMTRSMKVV